MTTPENAVAALRKIHTDELVPRPKDWSYLRAEALVEFNAKLGEYVNDLPRLLEEAYNVNSRQCGWYPIPFEQRLLNIHFSRALLIDPVELSRVIGRQSATEKLRGYAEVCGAKFTISVRPDGVSVICNFLETTGELVIQCP